MKIISPGSSSKRVNNFDYMICAHNARYFPYVIRHGKTVLSLSPPSRRPPLVHLATSPPSSDPAPDSELSEKYTHSRVKGLRFHTGTNGLRYGIQLFSVKIPPLQIFIYLFLFPNSLICFGGYVVIKSATTQRFIRPTHGTTSGGP